VIGTEEFTGAWDYASLAPNVRIGENCYLESKDSFARFLSTREPGLILGNGVRSYLWTAFNVEHSGRLEVGADSLLVGAIFMCAQDISVGKRVIISYNVAIADCDFHPHDPEFRRKDVVANAPGGDLSQRPPLISRPVVIDGQGVRVGDPRRRTLRPPLRRERAHAHPRRLYGRGLPGSRLRQL
jgi:acetyltransferase-like isoleucine patch superfamily enzyme